MIYMADNLIHIQFDSGTLVLTGEEGILKSLPGCRFDQRSRNFRAEGRYYRAIIEHLEKERLPYQNEAQAYDRTPWPMRVSREPFYYQAEGLETWWNRGARGVVVLPTGAGKTYLAMMAIERVGRPTLVVTPKVALMDQWCSQMQTTFDVPIGLLGGGSYDIQPLTVTTYDSAFLYLERWGSRFGFLVFDECHHLPGPSYQLAAVGSIAPFRLGL